MSSNQPLLRILQRLEAADSESLLLSPDEISEWPRGAAELLLKLGLIKKGSPSKLTDCPGCEENCPMPVMVIPAEEKRPAKSFVSCDKRDDIGRIPIDLSELRRLQIDVLQLVCLLSEAFGAGQSPHEIREGRIFHIADAVLARKRRSIFFMRGATWRDGLALLGEVSSELQAFPNPLFLVPAELPPPGDRKHYSFASLAHSISATQKGLSVDRDELTRFLTKRHRQQARSTIPISFPPGTKWEDLIITLVNEETLKIAGRGIVEHRRFAELGFQDTRKQEETPDRLWPVLIFMAIHHGDFDWNEAATRFHDPALMKKRISEIRKKLIVIFPEIPGDPFLPFAKGKRYQTRFLLNALPSVFQNR